MWSCDKRCHLKTHPPQFYIPWGAAKGEGHVQRDLFDLHQWPVFRAGLCEIWGEGGIFFPNAYVTVFCVCMFVQMNVRVCLRQLLTSFH